VPWVPVVIVPEPVNKWAERKAGNMTAKAHG
jgi:hypothetical protein